MRSIPIVVLPLLLGACADSFKADESLALPLDSIVGSIVTNDSATTEDGSLTATIYSLIMSDRESLCSDLLATETGEVTELSDVFAVQVIALAVNTESFDTNAGLLEILLDPEAGDSAVAVRVIERVGGETVTDLGTKNLLDGGAIVDSQLVVGSRSMTNGEVRSMGASFSADLQIDRSNPEDFDTDIDDDGTNDYASINEEVKGRFSGAKACSGLEAL